jgi:hypothetical protein
MLCDRGVALSCTIQWKNSLSVINPSLRCHTIQWKNSLSVINQSLRCHTMPVAMNSLSVINPSLRCHTMLVARSTTAKPPSSVHEELCCI